MQENLRKKHKGAVAWGSSGPLREGKGSTWEGGRLGRQLNWKEFLWFCVRELGD